jgi:ribosomal protein S18 acetylase RimI-like enzyme
MTEEEIRRAEALMAEGWPAARTRRIAGWTCGFDAGVTRRANSVLPLAWDGGGLDAAIDQVEAAYDTYGLPPIFKLAPGALPAGLDARLAARGYGEEGHALVLGRPLAGAETRPALPVRLETAPPEGWAEIVNGVGSERPVRDAIVGRIARPRLFAVAEAEGAPAAGGLGVVLDGLLLVTALVTRPEARRRGAARSVVAALAAAGARQGTDELILQVETDNLPARTLYARLGWRERYRYAYRALRS